MTTPSRATVAGSVVVLVVVAGCVSGVPDPFVPDRAAGASGDASTGPDSMTVEVAHVEDGDTLWFRNETGGRVGVRLLGVDAPETRGKNYPEEYRSVPDTRAGEEWLDRWGVAATEYTRSRVEGETVRLVFDPNLPQRDFYGRLVAYVYHDGDSLNRALLEDGYARVFPVEFEKRAAFERVERDARNEERGLWNYSAKGLTTFPRLIEVLRR